MSQAEAPSIQKRHWSNLDGWSDLDFYRIKLVCDRVDGIGFRYYLKHPKEAWRDYWLWRKFGKLVKEKPKTKERAKTSFKHKRSWAPDVKKATVESKSHDLKDKIEEIKKKAVEYLSTEKPSKEKFQKLYDLALEMQANGMLPKTKEALDEQVDQMLKFNDKAFEAFKKTIEGAIKTKK